MAMEKVLFYIIERQCMGSKTTSPGGHTGEVPEKLTLPVFWARIARPAWIA